jgi:dipeptidyl aminopeptidase/acylaminoacyl peptidase
MKVDQLESAMRRRLCLSAALAPVLSAPIGSEALASEQIPIADFYRPAAIRNLVLSPNGKRVCGIRPVAGRDNVMVFDIESGKTTGITKFTDADVGGLGWVNDNRLIFGLIDRTRGSGDQVPSGLFVIDHDAANFKPLVERSFISEGAKLLPPGSEFHSRIYENGKWSEDILVEVSSMQGQGKFSSNVYRVNTTTGESHLLTLGAPGNARGWVFDRKTVARAVVTQTEGITKIYFREDEAHPWRQIFEVKPEDVTSTVTPLAFDAAGQLYVSANLGQDNAAIYRFDQAKGSIDPQPVFAVKGFDITGGLIFSEDGATLKGVRYDADRSRTYWLDPQIASIQNLLDQQFADSVNQLQVRLPLDEHPVLVTSYSDRDPGRFLLFYAKEKQLQQVAVAQPWIKAVSMSPTRFLTYKARDGLTIPAQLTLPLQHSGDKPPLVVLHYGGPWVRPIHWGWDENVQFLASRGYAVFMPAPRASRGFGSKLFKSGWKQWGLAMQDDVTDGVKSLIADGLIDPNRVGIAGASYGGYLAMMALVKEPDLFKCGVNWVGVTDPSFMFTVTWTDFNTVDSGRYDLPELIGDPDKLRDQFKRTSPVERAAEIKQPVLMAYGGLDRRVPLVNGERLKSAMAPYNKNVEWVVYPDEGHGWSLLEDNVDFWGRVERFLAKNLRG